MTEEKKRHYHPCQLFSSRARAHVRETSAFNCREREEQGGERVYVEQVHMLLFGASRLPIVAR